MNVQLIATPGSDQAAQCAENRTAARIAPARRLGLLVLAVVFSVLSLAPVAQAGTLPVVEGWSGCGFDMNHNGYRDIHVFGPDIDFSSNHAGEWVTVRFRILRSGWSYTEYATSSWLPYKRLDSQGSTSFRDSPALTVDPPNGTYKVQYLVYNWNTGQYTRHSGLIRYPNNAVSTHCSLY